MKTTKLAMALAAGCTLSAAAFADVTFRMIADQDLSILCDSANNPTYYIGNNPSVCALVGDNLFVAGYHNNGATTGVEATCQMVKIETIFGTRSFRLVPDSQVIPPVSRGFYGLQYDYGPARAGLVLNYDSGSIGTAGAFKLYNVDSQLNPILVVSSPAGLSARGGAGPAFDYGASGTGFGSGPVLSVLEFSGYSNSVQTRGPFGIQVSGEFPLDVIQGRVYDADMLDTDNNPIAPIINGGGLSGTLWRDISIDPRNGNLAARASNDLVIARRNAFNGVASKVLVSCDTGSACDDTPFAILQRTELLWGSAAGDVVIFNRQAAGVNFSDIVLGADLDGQAVPLTFKDIDGTPFNVTSTPGYFDFSWDGINQRLAVLDFANRYAYIFEVETAPTCPPCAADFNQDGGVDGGDIEGFFTAWESGDTCGDTNQDGGVDGGDIEAFFLVWENGGC